METLDKPPPANLRMAFTLRLFALLLVQLAIVWYLSRPGRLWNSMELPRKIFPGVIPAAIVVDVTVCLLILIVQRSDFSLIVICTLTSMLTTCAGCGLTPLDGFPDKVQFWTMLVMVVSGWLVGCISYRIAQSARRRNDPDQQASVPIQFSLGHLLIAITLIAIATWLWSFVIRAL